RSPESASSSHSRGEPHFDSRTARVLSDHRVATVKTRKVAHHREAQAAAAVLAAGVGEPDPFPVGVGDAGSLVFHHQQQGLLAEVDHHAQPLAIGAVADGIVEQVDQDSAYRTAVDHGGVVADAFDID